MTGESYIKSNLHTHSTFCDGNNTIRENVATAMLKGIKVLGFTSHSMYPFWTSTYMQPDDFTAYCSEVRHVQNEFEDSIRIRLGFEADYIPGVTVPRHENYQEFKPDYLIGSVHFIFQRDGMFAVDHKPQILREGAKNYYKGNMRSLIGDYFSLEREMIEKGDFDIVGHPDLIRKFNDAEHLFSENDEFYKNELKETAKAIARKGIATEINTGAISRGYMKKPYPSEYFLEMLHEEGVPVAITSDSHSAANLDYAFEEAILLAKKTGYTEIIYDVDKAGYQFCKI